MSRYRYRGEAHDSAGNILIGATASIFLAGTTTPADVYESPTAESPVNSVESDENGIFVFYVDDLYYSTFQLYKVTVTADGMTTYTVDYIKIDQVIQGTYAIADDLTVSTRHDQPDGVEYEVASGKTLTFTGVYTHSMTRAFSGPGAVILSGIKEVYPEWWGTGNASFQSAVNAYKRVAFITDYVFTGTVTLPNSNLEIVGYGHPTIDTAGVNSLFKQTNHGVKNIFRGIAFTGGGKAIEYACDDEVTSYDEYLIEDCSFVMDAGIYGIYLVGSREGNIKNCSFETGNGIYTSHANYRNIEGCFFKECGVGIYDAGAGSDYSTGSYIINTLMMGCTIGVRIVRCDDFCIMGSTIDYNDTNILISGQDTGKIIGNYLGSRTAVPAITINSDSGSVSSHIKIIGNKIGGHYTDGSDYDCISIVGAEAISIKDNIIDFYTRDGISYDGATFLKVIGNHFARRPTFEAGYAIRGANDSDSNVIAFNTASEGTLSGVTSSQLFNNRGYYTSWSGTGIIGSDQTSVTVSHLMSYTPADGDIMVTPTNDMGNAVKFWISDLGATTFKINVDVQPITKDATFVWMLRKRHY